MSIDTKNKWKVVLLDITTALLATLSALTYIIFVFPNRFAPTGINGIATIIQHLFGVQLGYLSLIVNIPLCIIAFWKLNSTFSRRTFIYVCSFSAALMILEKIDAIQYLIYEGGYSGLLGPLVAAIVAGGIYGIMITIGGSTGGIDVVGALVHAYRPQYSTVWVIFIINTFVAFLSYFVYGFQMEPVLLCIMYSFVSTTVSDYFLRGSKAAVKVEIVTSHAEEVSQAIISEMHRSCTMIAGKGAYTHTDKTVLFCVIQKDQVHQMMEILKEYPDTFAYISHISETLGNFLRAKEVSKGNQTTKK